LPLALLLLLAAPGDDVLERHECYRCHAYEGAGTHAKDKECAGCHVRLSSGQMDGEASHYSPQAWERFKRRTGEHYTHVPGLSGLSRLRTSWLKSFLKAPYDLRPQLSETMIRNTLTDADLEKLAQLWKTQPDVAAPPKPPAARLTQAAQRFTEQGCAACHELAGSPLAPDLRLARERMNFSDVVAYVKNPLAVNRSSQMPALNRSDDEARLLAEHVYFGELKGPPPPAERAPPPYDAKAPVPKYEEVEARVFKKICWHCHSNPDFADGNGGPGMTGGMGYPARALSFASFAEVMSGSRDDGGQRQSIFRLGKSGEPVLLEVLRARYHEEATRAGPNGPIGMPLGLPALAPEDFALVERWVRGGRPPPRGTARKDDDGPQSPMLTAPPN
jgi:mono/diheme cytochrome c family protein